MDEKQCSKCCYYMQHYTLDSRRIFRVYCGHCTFHKVRHKLPSAKACKDFSPGTNREDAFVSKEYLSKELLQYVLRMELFPKIDE